MCHVCDRVSARDPRRPSQHSTACAAERARVAPRLGVISRQLQNLLHRLTQPAYPLLYRLTSIWVMAPYSSGIA